MRRAQDFPRNQSSRQTIQEALLIARDPRPWQEWFENQSLKGFLVRHMLSLVVIMGIAYPQTNAVFVAIVVKRNLPNHFSGLGVLCDLVCI